MNYNTDPFEEEILVKDRALQTVLKVDNLKTQDLIARRVSLSRWQGYVLRRIAKVLQKEDYDRVGKVFIRRRMIVYGIGVFETDNGKALNYARKREEQFLEGYNPRTYAHMGNKMELANWDTDKRTQIYLEDSSFEYISTLSEICRLSFDTVVRLAVSYSSIALRNSLPDNIIAYARGDICELKEHFDSYAGHRTIGTEEDEQCLEWLREQGAVSFELSNVSIHIYIEVIEGIAKIKTEGARKRFYKQKSLRLIDAKQTGQHSSRVWINE